VAYDRSDPREALATSVARNAGANVAPQYFEFDKRPSAHTSDGGSQMWWVRSQSAVLNFVRAKAGDPIVRSGQPDEYMIVFPTRGAAATMTHGHDVVTVVGPAVIVVPPGDTQLMTDTDAEVIRVFTTQSPELCSMCDNNDFYATADPNVAPFVAWPAPPAGHQVRTYPIDEVPMTPGRFGRIFRCSTIMINYLAHNDGPRDPSKMSPHHHDDFEQLSLQLSGEYVHHIRTPWTVNMAEWRDDEHQFCTSPSVTIIPPPSLHTSQAVGMQCNQLIDIFCPPRVDFSAQPGWVLNADEYPVPG
jgi:hypothetical protein